MTSRGSTFPLSTRCFQRSRPLPSDGPVVEVLERNLTAAAARPDACGLLALYLFNECLRAWEETDFYRSIGQVVRSLDGAVGELGRKGVLSSRPNEAEFLAWTARLAQSVIELSS